MTTKQKPWLMSKAQVAQECRQFIEDYFGSDGAIFGTPHAAGYWLCGIRYHKARGWLAFEFYDNEDEAGNEQQQKAAIAAWRRGEELPANYFALTREVAAQVFANGLGKWGQDWIDEIDSPSAEEALQWTILGEQRYG